MKQMKDKTEMFWCSSCDKKYTIDKEGEYCKCGGLIISDGNIETIRMGKIPNIKKSAPPKRKKGVKRRPKVNKANIRIGTRKHRAYELWSKGRDVKESFEIMSKEGLNPNPSSLRSWFSRFNKKR